MRRHPFIVRHARGGSANIVATHGYLKVNSSVVQATSENSETRRSHDALWCRCVQPCNLFRSAHSGATAPGIVDAVHFGGTTTSVDFELREV
ncbi:MAG: hypothetical protein EBY92_01515 [Actinobacteria bacterium]|nr:hypothetical protein [Actinomycetota bacterium]NDA53543.1 hypothetical protein [Actinomycetota bacterium]NDH36457.1 hypothetical protein [Acidimicrobiia bacterium]